MYQVYVVDCHGEPMDPTVRFGKVRRLLKAREAKVIQHKPFTVQLLYETKKHFTKQYHGGTDPGRENIGNAVITDNGDVPYADHITTRNQDIPGEMKDRKAHRQASRRGERSRRKHRAKTNDTTTDIPEGRDDIHYDNDCYEIRQFRRQDRAMINNRRERTYKLNGQTVAKNRKPREEQKYPALSQWFKERVQAVGRKQAEKERSQLKTVPSFRRYNTAGRIFPGATFLYHDKRYVMTGQMTNGQYYRAAGAGSRNFPAKQCKLLTHNTGLVYL